MTEIARNTLMKIGDILHDAGWDQGRMPPHPGIESAGDEGKIDEALGRLAPELRSVAVMAYMDGMPLDRIARTLNVPLGTIQMRLHDARLRLREKLLQPEQSETRS